MHGRLLAEMGVAAPYLIGVKHNSYSFPVKLLSQGDFTYVHRASESGHVPAPSQPRWHFGFDLSGCYVTISRRNRESDLITLRA